MTIANFPDKTGGFALQIGKNFDIQHCHNPVSILGFVTVLSDNLPIKRLCTYMICAMWWLEGFRIGLFSHCLPILLSSQKLFKKFPTKLLNLADFFFWNLTHK